MAALLEGNANLFFASPYDIAGMLNSIAPGHQDEVVGNSEWAGNVEVCSGARQISNLAVNATAIID
jgi:hypothetical protein